MKCATGSTNIYKQHIMHALMDAGYADSIYGELYDKLFAPGTGAALIEAEYPDTREVLELIHSAGGIAVLAHPMVYHSEELLEELADNGLDGVEVWHPNHSQDETEQLRTFAEEKGLLMTRRFGFSRYVYPICASSGQHRRPGRVSAGFAGIQG